MRKVFPHLAIVLTSLFIVCIYYFFISPYGLEILPDSTAYIRGALNIQAGLGYTYNNQYINHFPPAYSFLLSVMLALFPGTVFSLALYLNVILLFVVSLLFAKWLDTLNISLPIRLVTTWCFMFSVPVSVIGTKLLTELPTLLLIIGSFLSLSMAIKRPKEPIWWFLIGGLLGIAVFFRFAAIGFVLGFAICPFVLYPKQTLQNGQRLLKIMGPGFIGLGVHHLYVLFRYNSSATDRQFLWHVISQKKLIHFIQNPFNWFIDYHTIPTVIFGGIITLLLIGLFFIFRKRSVGQSQETGHFIWKEYSLAIKLNAIVSISYCLFLIFSISFLDGYTPVNTRILSLLSPGIFLLLAFFFQLMYEKIQSRILSVGIMTCLSVCLSYSGFARLISYEQDAYALNGSYWNEVAKRVVQPQNQTRIQDSLFIYHNHPYWFRLITNNANESIPVRYELANCRLNHKLQTQINLMQKNISDGKAQLIYFYKAPRGKESLKRNAVLALFSDTTQYRIQYEPDYFTVRKKG